MDIQDNLVSECRTHLKKEYDRLRWKFRHSSVMDNGHFGHGNHMANDGFDVSEQMTNQALHQNEEYLLREIEDALRRVELGIYGICEACSQEIGSARLKILPHARFCIKCQNDYEKGVLGTNGDFSKWMHSPDKPARWRATAIAKGSIGGISLSEWSPC